jgi:predicted transposase YdaD
MAFPFDQSFKLVNEEDAAGSLKYVPGIRLSSKAVVESLDRELNLERLHADHLYRVRDRQGECIHHFEALAAYRAGWEQSQFDHAVYVNLKYTVPVYSHLLLMHARGVPRLIPERIVRLAGGLRQSLRVNIIRLWQRPAADVLAAGRIALYPWTALMSATPEQQREAAYRLKASGREGLQMQMALMGTLRYGSKEAFFERIGRMLLTKDILRESPLWQEIEREAEAKGRTEGRVEGKAEGEAEGEAKALRRSIRVFLMGRFGTLPAWAEQRLDAAGVETLEVWLDRTARATTLDAIFE